MGIMHVAAASGSAEAERVEIATGIAAAAKSAAEFLRTYRDAGHYAQLSEDPLVAPRYLKMAGDASSLMVELGIVINIYAAKYGEGAAASLIDSLDDVSYSDACLFRAMAGGVR